MAELFGSALVSEMINRAGSFLSGKYKMQKDVRAKLERLQELLIKIKNAIVAAEGQEIHNYLLLQWLWRLKDAAYQADDVLDTFDYRILEQEANKYEVSSHAAPLFNTAKRIRTVIRIFFSCDEDVNELNNVVDKLERIAADMGDFLKTLELDVSSKMSEMTSRRITSSMLPDQPIGREKEKEQIIKFLLQSKSGDVAGNVSVIPILGIGGVGKTTLAQLICKDERVREHFSLIMWVCVSDSFDVVRLTREILGQAQSRYSSSDIENLDKLQMILKEKLSSQRFLLVLDDIWNENNRTVWETLRAPLLCGKEGSKIIVTSRLEKVAKLMGSMDPIRLQGLPEEEYWSFFRMCAFGGADPEQYSNLVAIGKEIAKKLKGSPLAAKTLGGLLKGDLSHGHWEKILMSNIWKLEQGQDDIMPVLRLTYQHLPAHLQRCFAYCSLFPKDWEFKRDDLIYMWVAEGLIQHGYEKKEMENIGGKYFDDLISKAFFQPCYKYLQTHSGYKIYLYRVHDLLHDVAEFVSKYDCCRIEGDEPREIPNYVRHLSLTTNNVARLMKDTSVLRQLRTLNLLSKHKADLNVAHLQVVFEQLKSVRVLNIVNYRMRALPRSISNLIHLRYLNLSYTGIKTLSDPVCRLYHLQVLVLQGLEYNSLPPSMNKLINLRHLIDYQETGCYWAWDIAPSGSMIPMISGIGRLTCLQELKILCVQKMGGFTDGQLKTMREVRSLWIRNLENVGSKQNATKARLRDKEDLVTLKLSWCNTERNTRNEVEEEVLEGLQPHHHLKELEVTGYNGVLSPIWLIGKPNLDTLGHLVLSDCRNWKELPPFGQLPSLKVLKLYRMHAIKGVGCEFFGGGFPSLEKLVFKDFPELTDWCAVEDTHLFPCLLKFKIKDCSKLTELPALPSTIKCLVISRVGLAVLPAFFPTSVSSSSSSSLSLDRLSITQCPKLKNISEWSIQQQDKLRHLRELHMGCCPFDCFLPSSLVNFCIYDSGIVDLQLSRCLHGLSSLQYLSIRLCPHVTALPSANVMQHLIKLHNVVLADCGELRSIGGLRTLISLDFLVVSGCGKLTSVANQVEQLVEEEVGLSSLNSLTIDNPLLLMMLLSREGLSSLRSLVVEGLNDLATFTNDMEEAFHLLKSLKKLKFRGCNSLQCLPLCLKNLSFDELIVSNCPNFQSLLGNESLRCLKYLCVEKCHPMLKEQYHEAGPERHNIAHIPTIFISD
ncbi:disease resistance protein RGA2-like [Typha angustifolia]|uniref:disease resistance protein RGA2-like n=1 Tax=Typha angustifolia TaxID=59011 RepID=UPI003C30345B